MPLYLKPIYRPVCGWPACRRLADREVFNSANAPVAAYCNSHSEQGLRKAIEEQEAMDRRDLIERRKRERQNW